MACKVFFLIYNVNDNLRDISVFSMISKEITSCVVDYISTIAWRNKNIIRCSHPITTIQQRATLGHYRDLGLLFKRCTLLQPTKERLKFIFSKFSQIPCFLLEQCDVPDCRGFTCYGAFLQTLIAGWDELECHRVFNFLCDLTNLLQKTEGVVMAKPGVCRHQELQLRLFCRHVLLNPWLDQSEGQFWLMLLLKPWPLFNQAKILFILYGPLLPEGVLGWQDVVVSVLPHNSLWELAKAILVLFSKMEVRGWSSDSMLAIFEELIVIPEQWHIENVARLLVLCGSSLCYTILASKALNGRLPEVSRLIVFIILVCQKDGYHISWAVKLVQAIWKAISTPPERFNFILQLENTFSDVTKEFYEQAAAGETERERELFISHFLGLLRPKMIHAG
uniref:FBXO47 ARM repeats region domain-containing protein n=1 Tax=Gouania willdenowi TaxID=441366 RepID=A0A8C5DW21_GOUWI